ncbi:MAG TPA: carbonic anhydrase family protein [Rhodocyclaceae bacterium]|nr:carbonic anhydrase family protein [Rhodocyclaceae bacterium]
MRAYFLVLIQCLAFSMPLYAADWLTVANDRLRRVELDKSSVLQSEPGTKVAWGRIVLSDNQAAIAGYKMVRALNRYDCRAHTFVIAKRVYLSAENHTLREEKVDDSRPISVKAGTVDERFFNEVCRPASLADLRNVSREVTDRLAGKTDDEESDLRDEMRDQSGARLPAPKIRHANIELARDDVSDSAPAAKQSQLPATKPIAPPVEKSAAASEPSAAKSKAPRLIDLPPPPPPRVTEPIPSPELPPPTPTYVRRAHKPIAKKVMGQTASAPMASRDLPWSYEGEGGPENWSKLNPQYATCATGTRQSPIDIRDGIKVDQDPIQFDYKPSYFRVIDNGHTIQVNYGSGSTISIMGRTYELVQINFHHPSEERVDGKGFEMVAHLVHKDLDGRIAVIAVLLERGQPQPVIQTIWNNLPLEKNEEYASRTPIQIADLLPEKKDYFSYMGSLTTPPCTEGVLWLVMKQPVQLSAEQIDIFTRFYPNNARPVQAAAGRVIKESR